MSFLPDFYADLPGEADRLDKEMREKVQIAQLSDTVVGKAKERLVESIQKDFKNKLIDFEKEYLEKDCVQTKTTKSGKQRWTLS